MGRYATLVEGYTGPRCPGIAVVQRVVATRFRLSVADLLARRRTQPLVLRRQLAIYLAVQLTGESLTAIGRAFGRLNHSTTQNAVRRVELLMERDPELAEIVNELRRRIDDAVAMELKPVVNR